MSRFARSLRIAVGMALLAVAPAHAADPAPATAGTTASAVFAGGCFWCMEPPFDALDGVLETTVGYTGGTRPNPTYRELSAGGTGHVEAIRVEYDPGRVTYAQLLDVYWRNIDPTQADGQFCDHGASYRAVIFYRDETQRRLAERYKKALEQSGRFRDPIVTAIEPGGTFWPAEAYHQDYYRKNPLRYKFYRYRCGRDARLRELWGEDESVAPGPAESDQPEHTRPQ